MFVLYNGFLLFAYITAFSAYEALRAASYWRYNMHLGAVGLAFAAYGTALLWRRLLTPRLASGTRRALFAAAVVAALALPVALSHKIRFDTAAGYVYARTVGTDLARTLKPGERILLIDSRDNGQYLVILRYSLHRSARIVGEITAYSKATPAALRRMADSKRASHVWIRGDDPEIAGAFGIQMTPDSSYLLARDGPGWSVARSWPWGAAR